MPAEHKAKYDPARIMGALTVKFQTIDDYMASLPEDVRAIFEDVRRTIHSAAPGSRETISYQIPALELNGKILVHFAAWKKHISLYPVPDGDADLSEKIAQYRTGKGTLQFPLRQPIPFDVIASIVDRLIAEHPVR